MSPEQAAINVTAFEGIVRLASYGETPIGPLPGWCSLAPIHPIGGSWYFGFECPKCRRTTPFFRDCSEGNLGNPFVGYGFEAICFFCKADVKCASESAKSTQWPLAPGQTPPESVYAKRARSQYKDDPEQRPISGPLHHYTSLDALMAIVKTKTLRATNVHYLNDSSESELGLKLMRQVAVEALKMAEGSDAEFLRFFVEWLDGPVFDSASVYVLCLSEAHNQLSQWRGYTAHGQGVCLSFDSMMLVNRMQKLGWTFQQCRYNRTSQLSWAESILLRMRREVAENLVAIADTKMRFDAVLQNCLSPLLQVAATIKNEGFVEEREVRFISPIINVGDERIEYRVGRTALIPYVQFNLVEGEGALAIHEIMVGPSPTQHLTQSSITGVAKQNRLKGPCIVSNSKIPYREL